MRETYSFATKGNVEYGDRPVFNIDRFIETDFVE